MHRERHSIERIGWLRAAVLGANDGIVSTASLLLGVAAASASHSALMIAGVAGWVAGAMSMATGEYVSVSSQADTEKAALAEEQAELLEDYPGEFRELTSIYVHRGLDPALARQVAEKLMAHDALEAHTRDELGISSATRARPLQAALASALSFSLGALLPLLGGGPLSAGPPNVASTSTAPPIASSRCWRWIWCRCKVHSAMPKAHSMGRRLRRYNRSASASKTRELSSSSHRPPLRFLP